jgi:guanylate kinase
VNNLLQLGSTDARCSPVIKEMLVPNDQEDRVRELRRKFEGLPGKLVVISGPSAGAGKGKVIRDLLAMAGSEMWLSVSMTTRQVRADDVIHHTYNFVRLEEFERAEKAGELLEANGVTEGNRYGTPLKPILDRLADGKTVLLEIEVRGAQFVRSVLPDTLCVFIKPTDGDQQDDIAELRRRLAKRGTSDAASTERRIKQAAEELELARELGFYDRWVVNATGASDKAAAEIYDLIRSHVPARS